MDKLYFLPLGGAGEIGMNLNLYRCYDEWLIVDLGVSFNDRLGIDIIMPNPQYIIERKDAVKGIVLTHAHEDHIGAMPYIWPQLKCPIYTTPFTAELLRRKLDEHAIDYDGYINEVPLEGTCQIGSHFAVEFVSITHSIPEPNALIIRTPLGKIFHTGDWKIDPDPLLGAPMEDSIMRAIGDEGIQALVCDSTNVFCTEHSGSEGAVRKNLKTFMKTLGPGRLVVTCFASNLARLHSIALAAKSAGRRCFLMGRSLKRMYDVALKYGYMKGIPAFLTIDELKKYKKEQVVLVCSGSQGEPRSALFRIAMGSHHKITLEEGDQVLFSSRVIPGNEKSIALMKNNLLRQGVAIHAAAHLDYHVSGHPSRQELEKMYEWIRPNTLIPVHGELQHMVEQARLAKKHGVPHVVVPENGCLISIDKTGAHIEDEVISGRLAYDCKTVLSLEHPSVKERQRLSINGAVFVSLYQHKDSYLTDISFLGLLQSNELKEDISSAVRSAVNDHNTDVPTDERIRLAVRRYISSHLGKKPQVIIHQIDK